MSRTYLLIGLFSLFGISVYAQHAADAVSLQYLLKKMEARYDVAFAFDPEVLSQKTIQIDLEILSLEEALRLLCQKAGLQQKQVGNQILLRSNQQAEAPPTFFSFSGTIQDLEAGMPLFGALVFSGEKYAETDENGYFEIVVPAPDGQAELCLHYLGFENMCRKLTQSQKNVSFSLKPQSFEVQSVTVTSVAIQMDIAQLDIVERAKIPALAARTSSPVGSDVLRGVQLLAGLDATNDRSADIRIRNGDQEETLIMLEQIPLYHTSHMQGFFSTLNPLVSNEVEVFKNNIPIDKNSRTGGLVLAKVNGFGSDTLGGALEVNNLTGNLLLNSTIKNSQLLIAGRTSWGEISEASALVSETEFDGGDRDIKVFQLEPTYEFNDFNASFNTSFGKSELSINGIYATDVYNGISSFEFEDDDDDDDKTVLKDFVTNEQHIQSLGLGAHLSHPISEQWHVAFEAATSHYDFEEQNTFEMRGVDLFTTTNTLRHTLLKAETNYKHNDALSVKAGISSNFYDVAFDFSYTGFKYLQPTSTTATSTAFYTSVNKKLGKKTYLGLSGRLEHYSITDRVYPTAMVTLQHRLNADWLLKSAWSHSNQLVRKSQHQGNFGNEVSFWALADEKLFPVLSSNQWMLGSTYKGENGWSFDIEGFSRNNQGVAQYALANFIRSDSDLNRLIQFLRKFEGASRTIGLDMSVSKKWNSFTSILNYSLANKELRFDRIAKGSWFQSPDNRLHQLKFINEYEYKNWRFSVNTILGSSTLTINLDELEEEDKNIRLIPFEELYEELPYYFRLDVGVQYALPTKQHPLIFTFNTFNVTNRNNVLARYYIRLQAPKEGTSNIGAFEQALLGRIFSIGLKYKW